VNEVLCVREEKINSAEKRKGKEGKDGYFA
jgi:hypothetical protein